VFLLEEKPLGDMGCISEATWPPPAAAAMGDPIDGDTERREAGTLFIPPPPPPEYLPAEDDETEMEGDGGYG